MSEFALIWSLYGLAAWSLWAFDGMNEPGPLGRGLLAGIGWLTVYVAAGPIAMALMPLPNRL